MLKKTPDFSRIRVALVHDYLREYGGAERVLEALHEMFPEAPVFVAFTDSVAMGTQWSRFERWNIQTTWAQHIPGIKKLYSPLRFLAHRFFQSLDLSDFDVVISSTNMYMAKAVRVHPPAVHLCYCHTPPRSLYGYATMSDWKKNPIIRLLGELNNHVMRKTDWNTAQNPTLLIANSHEVQKRISKFYRRDSIVIHPPADVPKTLPNTQREKFCLVVSRLAASKHVDVVVQACTRLGVSLKVVGSGKMLSSLRKIAGPSVEFCGSVNDEELHRLYASAALAAYPAEDEDYGIVPVEAMGFGVPVIVHRSGGSLETVKEDETGLFVSTFEVKEMENAIRKGMKKNWNRDLIHTHAQHFSKTVFQKAMKTEIERLLLVSQSRV